MFLALKEIRRSIIRFGLVVAAIALLVFLILFQQSLQNSLITGFVGAIRNQSAPVLVYSVDGQRVLQASVISPEMEAQVADADGVEAVGYIGQGTFTGRPTGPDGEPAEAVDTTIIGYEAGPDGNGLGAPTTLVEGRLAAAPGEVTASQVDAADGFDIGDVVRIEPGGLELTVVGLASDAQLSVSPTLFATYETYLEAIRATNPDAGEPLPNVLGVATAAGYDASAVAASINDQSVELDALTRSDAADQTPGVAQVQQSFTIIFLLYALVVPFVTGLFFLIVTFQKATALTLLRAIGAPGRRLVASLLIQVALIVGAGIAVGTALYLPLSQAELGGLALRFETGAVLFWSGLLLTLGLASALLAARRVLAIDPVEATTGAGVGR